LWKKGKKKKKGHKKSEHTTNLPGLLSSVTSKDKILIETKRVLWEGGQ